MSGRHRVIAGHDKADATDGNDSPKRSESAYASAQNEKKLHGCNLPMERCDPVRMDRCLQSRVSVSSQDPTGTEPIRPRSYR
jgi:hypothetical protein